MEKINAEQVTKGLCDRLGKTAEEISLMLGKTIRTEYRAETRRSESWEYDGWRGIWLRKRFVNDADFQKAKDYDAPSGGSPLETEYSMLTSENKKIANFLALQEINKTFVSSIKTDIPIEEVIYEMYNNFLRCFLERLPLFTSIKKQKVELYTLLRYRINYQKGSFSGHTKAFYCNLVEYDHDVSESEAFFKKHNGFKTEESALDAFAEAFNDVFSKKHILVEIEDGPNRAQKKEREEKIITMGIRQISGDVKSLVDLIRKSHISDEEKSKYIEELQKAIII